MILPDISPSLIADLAALLPQLEEINLVALRSSTVLWPHGEPWQYAEAIAAWPNLKVFGLNGTPTSSQQRPQRVDAMKSWKTLIEKSQSIQKLNIWHSFGDTNYYGR